MEDLNDHQIELLGAQDMAFVFFFNLLHISSFLLSHVFILYLVFHCTYLGLLLLGQHLPVG